MFRSWLLKWKTCELTTFEKIFLNERFQKCIPAFETFFFDWTTNLCVFRSLFKGNIVYLHLKVQKF